MTARTGRPSGAAEHRADPVWAADAWVWEWNLHTGAFILDERAAAAITPGPDRPAIATAEDLFRMMNPDDRDILQAELQRYLAEPEGVLHASVRLLQHSGAPISLTMRGRLASRTAEGAPEWLVGLAIEQTTERAREDQMQAAFLYARSLIEASLDPLVTIGTDGRIMDVNRATESATGRSRDELIGSDFSEYFTDPEQARAGYQQVFTMGRVVDYPLTLQHSSGRRMDVLYNASTYHDEEGRVAGVFAAARDVTEALRSQRELQEANREVMLLSQMSDLLQSCHSVAEAVPILQASLEDLFPRTMGRGFLLNADTNQLEEALVWGGSPSQVDTVSPADCWALRRNAIHDVHLSNHLNPPCHYLAAEERPYLCVPLLAQGQALGIIHVVDPVGTLGQAQFTHLARAAADSISLGLANIRLRENLQALSTRDPLTGLYNRRFLEDALARELSRAGRNDRTGAVAMIDIDHFKMFNDTHGHDAGDAVLVAVADQLRGFRDTDLPCRYGGEEFLLVLTDLTLTQAVARMEQFREEVASLRAFHNGRELPGITVSIGVAPFPQHGQDGRAVVKRADEALYRAKEDGRNRVEAHVAP